MDASVIAKEFKDEDGWDYVERILTASRDGKAQIITSQLGIHEVVRTIAELYRNNNINYLDFQRWVATVSERVQGKTPYYVVAGVSELIVSYSTILQLGFNLTREQSIHLATAFEFGCRAFVLDDKNFKDRIADIPNVITFDLKTPDQMNLLAKICEIDELN